MKKGDHQGNVSRGIAISVAVQSSNRIRLRATGEAHSVPGSHAFVSSRRSVKNPYPSESAVPPTNHGRSGSNVVARPTPLKPSVTGTHGPPQPRVEPMASTPAPKQASL